MFVSIDFLKKINKHYIAAVCSVVNYSEPEGSYNEHIDLLC